MDITAYEIVKRIHKTLVTGENSSVSSAELAYVTGLLEALLTTYAPPEEHKKPTLLDGVKEKFGV